MREPEKPQGFSHIGLADSREEQAKDADAGSSCAEQIELEKARTQRLEAQTKFDKQRERSKKRTARRGAFSKFKHRKLLAIVLIVIVLAVGAALYWQFQKLNDPTPEPQITTIASLESAMDVSYLSTLEYDYQGIAEHHSIGKLFDIEISDTIDYRVKYKATFTVSYDLTDIKFKESENGSFVAYLPDPQISKAAVSPNTNDLGYLPDTITAQISDVYALCEQDASEVDTSGMITLANEGLKNTVRALITPLLVDDEGEHQLEFDSLANYTAEETENATE